MNPDAKIAPSRPPGAFLALDAVMAQTSLRKTTIYKLISEGRFPAPIAVAANRRAWIEAEIDAWKAARIAADRPEGLWRPAD